MAVDSKYANLPGIAYDQPDVYETEDMPESDQYMEYPDNDDENISIEKLHLNPTAAYEQFRGKYLDASKVDFSDRITKGRKGGYDAISGWELSGEGVAETTFQKYQRLKCEFKELVDEVTSKDFKKWEAPEDGKIKQDDVIKDVKGMQSQLLNMRLVDPPKTTVDKSPVKPDQVKSTKSPSSGPSASLEICSKGDVKASQIARVTELEGKIQRLESVLGSEKKEKLALISGSTSNQTVLGCLNILNSKLSLLEPTHIELIESRLSSVLQKVTKISEKKLDVQELERTLKLSDLYDVLEESASTLSTLPEISNRLNSLRDLHQSAADIVKELAQIKSLQEATAGGAIDNEKSLKKLQLLLDETVKRLSNKVTK